MRYGFAPALIGLALLTAAPVLAEKPNEGRDMMREMGYGGLKGKKLEKAIKAAEAFPLGSDKNPVRENMPQGERAYLAQLRCADGSAPSYNRVGSAGIGPYGYIMDLYKVTCANAPAVDVYMDMYHDGGETRPVPGFTIASDS